jgi:hypothetical protein
MTRGVDGGESEVFAGFLKQRIMDSKRPFHCTPAVSNVQRVGADEIRKTQGATMMRLKWVSAVPVMLTTLAGCAGMGSLEEVLGGLGGLGLGDQVRGEVEWVDTRTREIQVGGGYTQSALLTYEPGAQVTYRNQRYPVSALERGDVIRAQVERGNRGELYARDIVVEASVGEGNGEVNQEGEILRVDGQVGWVDVQTGRFEVRSSQRTYTVGLPYNPSTSTRDRFRRLRNGDRVRIEAEQLGNARLELRRFL